MYNFLRASRIALRFPGTIIGTLVCSLLVALCWGASIGAIYPFVEVVFRGDTLQTWMKERIQLAEKTAQDLRDKITGLEQNRNAAEVGQEGDKRQLPYLRYRLQAEEAALATGRWLQPFIQRYLPDSAFQTIVLLVAFLLLGTVVKYLFLAAASVLGTRLAQRCSIELRNEFFCHALDMEMSYFDNSHTGELISRNGDVTAVGAGMTVLFGQGIREPFKMVACLIGAAMVSWQLLIMSFFLAPVGALLVFRLNKAIRAGSKRIMQEGALYSRRMAESYSLIQVVKASAMEPLERKRFDATMHQMYRTSMRTSWFEAASRFNTELAGVVVLCLAILVGGYLVVEQRTHIFGLQMTTRPLTVGGLLLFFGFLAGASEPGRKMADLITGLQRGAAAADRMYEVLDRPSKVADPVHPTPVPGTLHDLSIDNVTFSYQPNQPVLQNINLRLSRGETLGIVGPNGCGKSTLASLILRFYDPVQGAVLLDGIDLRQFRQTELRGKIGIVTQQPVLFDDTIMNNIRYGSLNASDDAVIAASKKAFAHDFIIGLENGYDTQVGERGGRLSGGQRQRIVLARAILRDPDILILDEATNQIDAESERLIHMALKEFIRDRMAILITHRLSALQLADRVAVLESGRLIGLGTHAELMGKCELYQRFHQGDLRKPA